MKNLMYLCRQSNYLISKFQTMDFRTQIFEALKAKFSGGNAAVLNRIADKLAKTVTTAEQVTTAVAGITQEFIEMMESYGDARATEAAQTSVRNYEATHGIKDGKPVGGGQPTQSVQTVIGSGQSVNPQGGSADVPAWAQTLIDSNKAMADEIARMKTERTTSTRRQQLSTIVAKLPENLRKPYDRMALDTLTDEAFNTLVGEVTAEVNEIASDLNAKGAVFGTPAAHNQGGNNGELTKEQVEAISRREGVTKDNQQPF